ncbi:hypothetical protein KP509_27G045600 [Ceratopteris richardii]|uniref:Uncharacterized protein n=1 Tax=Ceratopteris richardii TaxID=49495 RepID=A0A8T2RG00_CERRI|nr:hypothetical protein KP509_27G045600 [Ceratopteris richardii]
MAQTAKDKASGASQGTQEKTQQLKDNAVEELSHDREAIKGAMGKVTGNNEGGAHKPSVLLAKANKKDYCCKDCSEFWLYPMCVHEEQCSVQCSYIRLVSEIALIICCRFMPCPSRIYIIRGISSENQFLSISYMRRVSYVLE